jgi:hypothetical protein
MAYANNLSISAKNHERSEYPYESPVNFNHFKKQDTPVNGEVVICNIFTRKYSNSSGKR